MCPCRAARGVAINGRDGGPYLLSVLGRILGMKGGNGYNRGLCSVSLAGWPCRVSQALRIWLQILWLKANVAGVHHPKDKSWSSFDFPAAAPKVVLSSTSSLPTSACAVMAAFIERIGFYNPTAKENEEGLRIVQDRLTYWKSVGAQSSPTVDRLIKQAAKKAA
jgi:hypothetical protein